MLSSPKERPTLIPLVDHARCEARYACVNVGPENVFSVYQIDDADRRALSSLGRLRSRIHGGMTAYATRAEDCSGCGLCVDACDENAVRLVSAS